MTQLLASVTGVDEALIALAGGADIIDLKNPEEGALGALPLDVIRDVVDVVAGRRTVSATIGDLPMQPDLVRERVDATAATGADIVKIGMFGKVGHAQCIQALSACAHRGVRMVAVMFADQEPDFDLLPLLAASGFYGVMLDTAGKQGRGLLDFMSPRIAAGFVASARHMKLMTGLAGSLKIEHVPLLFPAGADYLGFRGALCTNQDRKAAFESDRLQRVVHMLRKCNTDELELAC